MMSWKWQRVFRRAIAGPGGAKARPICASAGSARKFKKNSASVMPPKSRNALKEYLASKGAKAEQMEACGMVVHGEGIAVSYDRFPGPDHVSNS